MGRQEARGRLDGRRVVSYYDRAGIESGRAAVRGREIAWLEDPIDINDMTMSVTWRPHLVEIE